MSAKITSANENENENENENANTTANSFAALAQQIADKTQGIGQSEIKNNETAHVSICYVNEEEKPFVFSLDILKSSDRAKILSILTWAALNSINVLITANREIEDIV